MEFKEVFEPIINFMKSFQKKDKERDISKQAAKDRLKLVLMQDRASVSPDFFEMMKKEIIDVIKKYIEIDEESLEVQLTRGFEAGLEGPALYANIPIKNIKPVASNGEENVGSINGAAITEKEIEKISDAIVDGIFDEAEAKAKLGASNVEIKTIDDVKVDFDSDTFSNLSNIIKDDFSDTIVNSGENNGISNTDEVGTVKSETKDTTIDNVNDIAKNVAKEMKKSAKVVPAKAVKKTATAKKATTTAKKTTKKSVAS